MLEELLVVEYIWRIDLCSCFIKDQMCLLLQLNLW
jgi:hypothetical protein